MTKLMNLTKHDVRIILGGTTITIPPSGYVARTTDTNQILVGHITYEDHDIPVYRWDKSDIKNLPPPTDDTIFLTSGVVAQIVKRPDVLCPNTSPQSLVRDVYGNKVGVRSLISY